MQTKHIEKLEELNGFGWTYKNREFELISLTNDCCKLYENNYLDMHGKIDFVGLKLISLKNLTELEFYGLKVVLNEKPKLTAEDHKFLQKLNPENGINKFYITRDLNGTLVMNFDKPQKNTDYQEWHSDKDHILVLSEELFPFITWESGKAWSKTELMELEVIDD